jgi:hypothetical protein
MTEPKKVIVWNGIPVEVRGVVGHQPHQPLDTIDDVPSAARAALAEENPDALWPDGFEAAYLGLATRCGQPTLAAFSMRKAISVLIMRDGMSYEEAEEFLTFNVTGAWCGPGTPIWIDDLDRDADFGDEMDDEVDKDNDVYDGPFLGPEDLPSGLEDSWPAPDTTTPTDTTGETPPGTDDSTRGSIEPDAGT